MGKKKIDPLKSQKQEAKPPDKRRFDRHPFTYLKDFSIKFKMPGDKTFLVSSSGNVSFGGVLLSSDVKYSIGDGIEILVSYHEKELTECIFNGTVRWVENIDEMDSSKGYFIGVQFDPMEENKNVILKNFVNKYILKDWKI